MEKISFYNSDGEGVIKESFYAKLANGGAAWQSCKNVPTVPTSWCYFFQLVLIFGPFWVIFGPFGQFGVIFGPIWAILGHIWAILGNLR